MRISPTIFPSLLLGLLFTSCQKFVDIKKSSSQSFLTTASDCQLMLDNYTTMNTGYPIDGEISSDDYYLNGASYQLATIPQEEKELYTWNTAAQRTSSVPNWLNPYQVIYNANLVLQALNKLKESNNDPTLLNTLRGSALFYRAYCFWNIAQLYAKPYTAATASQDPGIPLRLDADVNEKSTRGTVMDTYNRILQDLREALSLLPSTSSISTRPNKAAVYAMLARTYLSMEDYPNAGINANSALQINNNLLDYNSISKTSGTPFTRFNVEVIFHSITYSRAFSPIAGPILAPGRASNNTAKINPVLVASYAPDDLRSQIYLKANTTNGVVDGTFRFTGSYENASSSAIFFTGLAIDEMYLIRSECSARAGNKDDALLDLNKLLSMRWKTGMYTNISAGTPEEALSKVLEERRKELLMRGLRWTDLRRLKKSITRNVTVGTAPNEVTTSYTLPSGDPRFTLLIPKEVMNNSNIAQNVR